MKITESRLRQIIREEVELRIVKQTITEVVSGMNLNLTEEQRILLEKSVLDQIKSAAKKAALPIGVMAALAFGLQVAVDVQQLDGIGTTPAAAVHYPLLPHQDRTRTTRRELVGDAPGM